MAVMDWLMRLIDGLVVLVGLAATVVFYSVLIIAIGFLIGVGLRMAGMVKNKEK